MTDPEPQPAKGEFPATRWSLVVAAAADDTLNAASAGEALALLCEAYWYPLYTYARRRGLSPHDAEDRTQAFFATLLERRSLAAADPAKGRLRTFLLGGMKNFLAQEYRRDTALKRGGPGQHTVSIDAALAERRFADEPADDRSPDALFDQSWAYALLENVLRRLRDAYAARGTGDLFDALRGHLTSAAEALPHAEVAARFSMTEGAVRAAVFQLRKRYRHALHAEVLETVDAEGDARAELLHLREIIAAAS